MLTTLYQEYLYIIGRLKDLYKLTIEVDHKDIHSFFENGKPLFKLFYGVFSKADSPTIVVSFHIDMAHQDAITWFVRIFKLHPLLQVHESFIEDAAGETYLGEDAKTLKNTMFAQEVLDEWLGSADHQDVLAFVEADVYGRSRDNNRAFLVDDDTAMIEFARMKKPHNNEDIQ